MLLLVVNGWLTLLFPVQVVQFRFNDAT